MAVIRCTGNQSLRRLLIVSVVFSLTINLADAQFTNLRVFRAGDLFTKDNWRSLEVLKSFKNQDLTDMSTSRKGEIDGSSPIKRVSMMMLLQQLQQQSQNNAIAKKEEPVSIKTHQDNQKTIPVATDSNPVATPVAIKESQIRRVKLPAGSISYSKIQNRQPIHVSVNPHLQLSTSASELSTTEPSTTITTTEWTTPTTEPVAQVKESIKTNWNEKSKNSSVRSSTLGTQKRLSDMPNSPIYYIKLPSTAFVSVHRTPHSDNSAESFAKQLPIFVATTRRPGSATEATSSTTESSVALSTTTRKPPRTNSRIINIKGPFVFNGKPGGIYSAPAPYRPPNYLDILHSIYPKLKRAQFIRR